MAKSKPTPVVTDSSATGSTETTVVVTPKTPFHKAIGKAIKALKEARGKQADGKEKLARALLEDLSTDLSKPDFGV